jgi:hypothetical protein
MELRSRKRVPEKELRNFGLLTGLLFAGLFAALPLLRSRTPGRWPWIVAAVLWLAALLWPRSLTLLYRWWTRLGQALSWFNTRAILTLIFVILITPFGFVMRVFSRDRMRRGFDPKCESYRIPTPPQRRSMEKPF